MQEELFAIDGHPHNGAFNSVISTQLAVFDGEDVDFLDVGLFAVNHEPSLGEDVELAVGQDCADTDVFHVSEQLDLINHKHLLQIRLSQNTILKERCKCPKSTVPDTELQRRVAMCEENIGVFRDFRG